MSMAAGARNPRMRAPLATQTERREFGVGYYQGRGSYSYVAVAARPAPAPRPQIRLPPRPVVLIVGAALLALVLNNLLATALFGHGGSGHWSSYRPVGGSSPLMTMAGAISPLAPPMVAAVEAVTAPPPKPAAPAADPARPVVAPPTPDHTVIAPPSVTPATIEQVLQQYGSPAVGQGNLFYDLGVKYGIDPAYALAFYIHESAAGTKGVARFTKSIGNIRTTPGYRDYEGYRAYDTWAASIEDWYKLIKDLYVDGWGKRTVAQIIPTYAPSGDNNDPTSYIANVTGLVDSWQQK